MNKFVAIVALPLLLSAGVARADEPVVGTGRRSGMLTSPRATSTRRIAPSENNGPAAAGHAGTAQDGHQRRRSQGS